MVLLQRCIVFLSLAVSSTWSWPQLDSGRAHAPSLPFVPRSLPVLDDTGAGATLHILQPDRPSPPAGGGESLATLPLGSTKRTLPVNDGLPGTLTLPVLRAPKPGLVSRNLEVKLENRSDVAYYAQLFIGTPAQPVYAQLDTGSYELWVNPDCSTLSSSSDQTFCRAVGHYDPDDSSTSRDTGEGGELTYGVGSANISYYVDDVALSDDTKLKKVRFGVADGGTEDQFAGVMGLGYGKGVNTDHANVVDEMVAQGLISTKTFSVALGSKHEDGGVMVFGGVDTSKYRGSLARLPVVPADKSPDGMARYWVRLKSISHSPPSGSGGAWSDTGMTVFLDTGATLTLLPPKLVKTIAGALGSTGVDESGFYSVDCDLTDQDGSIDFAFDGVTISVPYREIVRHFRQGHDESCYLGIAPSDDFALLGDTFLRSAYVVFDNESDAIFMAPYQNCGSDVSRIRDSSDVKGLRGSCGTTKGGSNSNNDNSSNDNSSNDNSNNNNSNNNNNDNDNNDNDNSEKQSSKATSTGLGIKATTSATTSAPVESEGSASATSTATRPETTSPDGDSSAPTGSAEENKDSESGEQPDNSAVAHSGSRWAVLSATCITAAMLML